MTTIDRTAFARLETEGRLLSPVAKGPTHRPGRFGFRGELALKFAAKLADEARPPEITADQVLAVGQEAGTGLAFLAAYLHSFEYVKPLVDSLGDALAASGKYFLFCDNIDLAARYTLKFNELTFFVLPIDEATVYNEMLDLLYLEKSDLKRLDTLGKLDAIADNALSFTADFEVISYEDGLKLMKPVRNRNENRPV